MNNLKLGSIFSISVFILSACTCNKVKETPKELANWVDPFIGVEVGNTLPGAQLPFGMVRLGPDVPPPNNTTGYRSDKPIRGFSHNHVSGTGGGARYGNVLVIPEIGEINLQPEPAKNNEYAKPGYYSVLLQNEANNVHCELTATHRVGMHRYTFSQLKANETLLINYSGLDTIQANILLDASAVINMVEAESTENTESYVSVVSDTQIEGYGSFRGGWGGQNPYTVYYVVCFDRPFSSYGTWKNGVLTERSSREKGIDVGFYARFQLEQKGQIQLKVGISYKSLENARNNLKEIPDWDFDRVRKAADREWNDYLNLITIEGATPEQQTVFYTALYHTFSMPTRLGTDENPGWESDVPHFWDFYTLWDTYRTVMPLHTLIVPETQSEIIRCLIDIYEHRSWLPDAWTAGDYAYVQGGNNATVAITDAIVKGLKGFDVEKAYEAMKKDADSVSDNPYKYGRYLEEYNSLGYLSSNIKNGSSRTLEYAYNDYCIAQVAKKLGKEADYRRFLKQSYNALKLFDSETCFFWAKDAAGNWMPGFSPTFRIPDYWNGPYFYEGTPWAYSTYFPHDMQCLISKHGGNEKFMVFLDELFDDMHYELGNEPGFLSPYLYHYAGRPDKSFERIRTLLGEYKVGRQGLPGQDDSGAMSAWFMFSAMGFFPVAGQDVYLISSPLFPKSTIRLGNGKRFTIIAEHVSSKNMYVQSAELNGKVLDQSWFTHKDIQDGGKLVLRMGDTPTDWGTVVLPPSNSDMKF